MATRNDDQPVAKRGPDRRSDDRRKAADAGYPGPERRVAPRRTGRDRRDG